MALNDYKPLMKSEPLAKPVRECQKVKFLQMLGEAFAVLSTDPRKR